MARKRLLSGEWESEDSLVHQNAFSVLYGALKAMLVNICRGQSSELSKLGSDRGSVSYLIYRSIPSRASSSTT